MSYLRLTSSASVTPTEVGVMLRSDLGTFQLKGSDIQVFVSEIVPLLDGRRDREAVVQALDAYSPKSVLSLLDILESYGLVETVSDEPGLPVSDHWHGQREFFRRWGDPDQIEEKLKASRILFVGLEPWGVAAATELAAAGVGAIHFLDDTKVTQDDLLAVRLWGEQHLGRSRSEALVETLSTVAPWCKTSTGELALSDETGLLLQNTEWNLAIAATAADDLKVLQGLARFAHKANVKYVVGFLEGLDAFVGPIVVPGQTACWNCYRLRQLANSAHVQETVALQLSLLQERAARRAHTYLAPMGATLGHLLALEALKLVSDYVPSKLVGRQLVQNLVTLETSLHTIIRMPWCEICGGEQSSDSSTGGPLVSSTNMQTDPNRAPSTQPLDAVDDPETLRSRLAGWVDERTGIVRYLASNTAEANEPELPVTYSAIMGSYTEGAYPDSRPEIGSGKGLTTTQAMLGAVGEAIERYSAARYRKSDMHRAALNDLQEEAFDPRRLCLYEDWQYNDPDFPFVPFDPDRPIDWTKGYWLHNDKPVWLPALPTYFNYQVKREEQFCQVTSNGLAAGANSDDAALRATFELIERDAFMLTWLSRRPGRRLYVDSSLEVGLQEVLRQIEECGAQVELYLLDVGLSIPTVVCLGIGDGRSWPGLTVAMGSHASPRIAVRKAVLEQGHLGPYVRRLMLRGDNSIPAKPEDVRSLIDHALYYVPPERIPILDFFRTSDNAVALHDLEEPKEMSLKACAERLIAAGVYVAIADVTSPDVRTSPFRVARALGTDMQPIDFGHKLRRLANPRLKAKLGGALNPYPHPVA